MEKFKTKTLKEAGLSFDVVMSEETGKIWLTVDQISKLINRSKSTTWRYISSTYKEIDSQNNHGMSNMMTHRIKMTILNDNVLKNQPNIYSIFFVSELVNRYVPEVSEALNSINNKSEQNEDGNFDIIIYDNGAFNINVRVSLEDDTVWLTQDQIAKLFETTQQNISQHIKNIFEDGELDSSVHKDFLYTAHDGKQYLTTFYNLDLILAVGYRVKGKRANEFRRWASSVLKKYMINGYAANEDKIKNINLKILNLEDQIEITKIEVQRLRDDNPSSKEFVITNGQYYDAFEFISNLIKQASSSIKIIDPFFDNEAIKYLKFSKPDVVKKVYLTRKDLLSKDLIKAFQKQYGPFVVYQIKNFHDRFIIIDNEKCYSIGASLNHLGSKTFMVNKIESVQILNTLLTIASKGNVIS